MSLVDFTQEKVWKHVALKKEAKKEVIKTN